MRSLAGAAVAAAARCVRWRSGCNDASSGALPWLAAVFAEAGSVLGRARRLLLKWRGLTGGGARRRAVPAALMHVDKALEELQGMRAVHHIDSDTAEAGHLAALDEADEWSDGGGGAGAEDSSGRDSGRDSGSDAADGAIFGERSPASVQVQQQSREQPQHSQHARTYHLLT